MVDINIFSSKIAIEGLDLQLTFTVELSEPVLVSTTYYVSTLNNEALSGSDYTALTNQPLIFTIGQRVKTFTVNIANDLLNEADESFFVNIFDSTSSTRTLLATTLGNITDTSTADVTTTLPSAIESLRLTGTAAINGTGNGSNNILTGNSGNNLLDGGASNDTLLGDAGNDTLLGGVGDDILDGGAGADNLQGGGGNDTYIIDALDTISLEVDGGGIDTIQANFNYTLGTGNFIENLTLLGSATLGTGNEYNNFIQGNALANTLNGKAGNDTLQGGAGNDTILGELGDDFLDGGTGNDSLSGGEGNDTYVIDNAADLIVEVDNQGTDTVRVGYTSYTLENNLNLENIILTGVLAINATGNDKNNALTGNNNNNILTGGLGNDTLDGNGGLDTLQGGDGDDTYFLDNPGDVVDLVFESAMATGGNDTVFVNADYTLGNNLENLVLLGNGSFSGVGNTLANSLTGNDVDNYLDGLGGADIMMGGLGNDTYVVDNIGDQVKENDTANQGNDTVFVGYDTVNAYKLLDTGATKFIENVTLTGLASKVDGNSQVNILLGNEGSDTLNGGAGNDTLDGGIAQDSLIGGIGNDLYRISIVDNDIVTEASTSITEIDTVEAFYEGSLPTSYTLSTNVENLVFQGSAAINANGNASKNSITTNIGNDTLNGGDNDDTLSSGLGNDSLNGGNGNDTLFAGAGNDTLNGGEGNDILDGGSGRDTFAGGLGNDIYIVDSFSELLTEATNSGTDEVRATVSYLLKTDFENLTLLATTNLNGTGNSVGNVIIGNTGNNTLDGQQGNDSLLGGSGNDLLLGQDGDDSLNGESGTDTAYGGIGNDLYVVDNVTDLVIESVNDGIDQVNSSVSYTLAENVENLTLTGSSSINAQGNDLNNGLTGNLGSNILDGAVGNDTMTGGDGNDFYYVDSISDTVVELVLTNSGIDGVFASVNGYVLANNVENLTLIGSATTGTGNDLANRLIGNALNNTLNGGLGNDFLDGLGGNDTLVGGLGNDKYTIDSAGDVITESAGQGTDLAIALVSYTLTSEVENLSLFGTASINGTGNEKDNAIFGNSADNLLTGNNGNDTLVGNEGNDRLVGGVGNDSLTGGSGADRFEYVTPNVFSGSDFGNDKIKDFDRTQNDKIVLGKVTFGLAGAIGANLTLTEFASVANDTLAQGSAAKIVYSQSTGNLFFNANGALPGGDALILTNEIPSLVLLNTDFVIG